MATWEIWLDDPLGNRIKVLDELISYSATKTTNAPSPCNLLLPGTFDESLLRDDGIIEFWRTPDGGKPSLFNLYFIRHIGAADDQQGRETIIVKGFDPTYLIGDMSGNGRIVAYDADDAKTSMTDYADDMLKEIITDNYGADATDAARNLTSLGVSVAAQLGDAPSITRGFAWQEILPLMQEICENSRQLGTPLFFDFVPSFSSSGLVALTFTTWTGQPGLDLTNKVYFGKNFDNLRDAYKYTDRSREVNYVYAGGRGTGSDREVQEAEDTIRTGASVWNRREGFAYATDQASAAGVLSKAKAYLEQYRPERRFGGRILDTSQYRYGVDWQWGDKVTCEYRGSQFDALVKTVNFTVYDDGQEDLDCRVEIEE